MTDVIRRITKLAKRAATESLARRSVFVRLPRPAVSLTFDDVPRSAVSCGLPILERFGAKATFYVSLGMFEQEPEAFIGRDEVVLLEHKGHEIACHTYSHYRLSEGSAAGLRQDAERNRALLLKTTKEKFPRNFSFPFGEISFEAKRKLAPLYASLRGTCNGVNAGRVDLNCLRANAFSREARDDAGARSLIREARRYGGWVIFYLHGVSEEFDCDCPPSGLESLLRTCVEEQVTIGTVDDVLQAVGQSHIG